MTSVSALNHIHKTGLFGNHENKNEESLLKVSEIKNLLIVQIVQYKNSTVSFENIDIDSLKSCGTKISSKQKDNILIAENLIQNNIDQCFDSWCNNNTLDETGPENQLVYIDP